MVTIIKIFRTRAAWETWLAKNHRSAKGVWIKLYKKSAGKAGLSYVEALHGALCYGWVDGQKKLSTELSWSQQFKPRPPKRRWSRLHTENAERLIKAGRMKPAGLKEVRAAKRDGRWTGAYDPPGSAKVPVDLLRELGRDERLRAKFESLTKAQIYAIAYRLQSARNPEIRAGRLRSILGTLVKGKRSLW